MQCLIRVGRTENYWGGGLDILHFLEKKAKQKRRFSLREVQNYQEGIANLKQF